MTDKERERIEADLLAEDFGGAPVDYGATHKAITALEARKQYLAERLLTCVEQHGAAHPASEALVAEICAVETRIDTHQAQLKTLN